MAYAFNTLRPLFRERGKINAEVTGRLTEALGGIRIVKSYTAEKREEIVFTKGAHRLFRNIAQSMTGVSATTAGSTVVIGVVGVLMIWLGGRAVIAGEMTLGDLITYIFFIGLVAAPLVGIASIGTQITEAFAGLDRIREMLDMSTEVQEDAQRAEVGPLVGDVAFDNVWFEYNPGQPVLRASRSRRPPARTTALVGSSGSGKSTLIGLVMAFNRPTQGRILDRRPRSGRAAAAATTASSSRRCCRRTSCSTARLPRTSATRGPGATRDEIVEACRVAHCDEFISQFPQGYDTDRRRARRQALGRSAAARVDRARDPRRARAS